MAKTFFLAISFFFATLPVFVLAHDGSTVNSLATNSLSRIILPAPNRTDGKTVGQALSKRESCRAYARKGLDRQTLSDLLWATAGINRPDGRRTAPSAYGRQSIELYVVLDEGVYRYQADCNALVPLAAGRFQKATGFQSFVETAPVNLLFVADFSKLPVPDSDKPFLLGVDAGTMSQNASLYCSSKGLGTVVRAGIDGAAFGKILGLPEQKRILLAQTVGWPAR